MHFDEEHLWVSRNEANQPKVNLWLREDLVHVRLLSAEAAQAGESSIGEHDVVAVVLQVKPRSTQCETPSLAPLAVENAIWVGGVDDGDAMKLIVGQFFVCLANVDAVQNLRSSVGEECTVSDTVVACRWHKGKSSVSKKGGGLKWSKKIALTHNFVMRKCHWVVGRSGGDGGGQAEAR